MLRRTLTTLSLIGLLLSVGLWGVSYFSVSYFLNDSRWGCDEGALDWYRQGSLWSGAWSDDGWHYGVNYMGRGWMPSIHFGHFGMRHVYMPLWVPLLMSGILPAYALLPIHRRRKRKKLGLCLTCGYNLKGLTEPRCPECNTPFESHD